MSRSRRLAVAIASGIVFLGLLVAVSSGVLDRNSVDQRAVTAAHAAVLAHPLLLSLARGSTNLGAPVVIDVLAGAAALLLWLVHQRRSAVYVALVRLAAVGSEVAVKAIVGRGRPVLSHPVAHATGYSFPSGHATGAASVYLPLAVVACGLLTRELYRRAAVAVAGLICLVVAATRVLLGVHYPSDVLAGLALGACLTAAMMRVKRGRAR